MKKWIVLAVCLLLITTVAFSAAAVEMTATLSADKTELKRGESVIVTVSVSEFEACTGGGINVEFNKSVFTRSDSKWLLEGLLLNDPEMSFAYGSANAKTVSGNIYQFKLTAKEDAAFGANDITVTLRLQNASEQVSNVQTLRITVACDHIYENACDTTCDICKAERTIEHAWNNGEVTQAPNCTTEGVKSFTCTVCNAVKTENLAITDHNWNTGDITTAPTCSTEGVKTYVCGGCSATKTETMPVVAHNWNGGEVTKEVTCTEDGQKSYTCTSCNANKTETLTKKGHAYTNACDDSCNNCGETRQITHAYKETWSSDKSGHWHQCSVCGARKDESGHNPGAAATDTTPQICTVCNYIIQPAAGHVHDYSNEWAKDETGHWHECSGCSELRDQAEHTYTNACDSTCNQCGFERLVEHTPEAQWKYDSNKHWKSCQTCGVALEEEQHTLADGKCQCGYDAAAAGHEHLFAGDWIHDDTGHWRTCKECGAPSSPQSHIWDQGEVIREPSETVAGARRYICMFCNQEKTETIPSLSSSATEDGGDGYWMIIVALVGILVLCCCAIVLVGIHNGKKKTGKYSMK